MRLLEQVPKCDERKPREEMPAQDTLNAQIRNVISEGIRVRGGRRA